MTRMIPVILNANVLSCFGTGTTTVPKYKDRLYTDIEYKRCYISGQEVPVPKYKDRLYINIECKQYLFRDRNYHCTEI